MAFPENFGDRLFEIRGRRSRAAFAHQYGIHEQSLIRYEKNQRVPDNNFIRKILDGEGVSKEWLINGQGPKYISQPPTVGDYDENKNLQPAEINKIKEYSSSDVGGYETDLIRTLHENAALLRQVGDLRVEVERLKNQLNQAKEPRPNDEALLARLVQENKDLRARLKRFERAGLVVPPLSDIAQNGLPDRR